MIITPYKSCLIAEDERNGRVDIINPKTGKWMAVRSVRNAKWTITVWERLNAEFSTPNPQQRWDYMNAMAQGLTDTSRAH